jgi:hypothetical protein
MNLLIFLTRSLFLQSAKTADWLLNLILDYFSAWYYECVDCFSNCYVIKNSWGLGSFFGFPGAVVNTKLNIYLDLQNESIFTLAVY